MWARSLVLLSKVCDQNTRWTKQLLQIPEYCKVLDDADVIKNAFSLIFAFDEIVALGYRENVSLAQIRTFTEMDSQDERIQVALRQVCPTLSPVFPVYRYSFEQTRVFLPLRRKKEKQKRPQNGKQKN